MAEVAPAAASVDAFAPAAKEPSKKAAAAAKARKPSGPSVTELLVKAVTASKERGGVSLAALKKALAAGGYDVEKNNGRIKVGLRGLVSKGTLVQTKGTGASGSFKLNKKQAETKEKAPKKKQPAAAAAKARKPAAKKVKKAVAAKGAKKVTAKKSGSAPGSAKKAAKSPKKAKVTKPKKPIKSPAKAVKPKAKAKPKASKAKVAPKKK